MILPLDSRYIIVGDVHGCVDELKTLIKKEGFEIDENDLISSPIEKSSIVLLGDFIDKASEAKLKETIEFIYLNHTHQNFYLVLGNHEKMVYRYIIKDPRLVITPKTIRNKEKYYNTVDLLEREPELKEKFLKIYSSCHVWLKYQYGEDFSVTLTHAPCPKEYLAQEDEISKKRMVKSASRSQNPQMPLDELMPYIHREAEDNRHYHIFGHLSQPNIRKYKNRICIDTSAIYGNQLSYAIVEKEQLSFNSVPFENRQKASTQSYNILFNF